MKSKVSVLIIDIDNTLYDWFTMWYCSFNAMLDQLAQGSGIARETLESEIREIFKHHGTTEYSFLIQEIPSLKARHPGEDLTKIYSSAIQAYREARNANLHLYPGVRETLIRIKEAGSCIIAYTDSLGFYTARRIKKLQLDGIIDYLYSPEDHDLPSNISVDEIRSYPPEKYALQKTVHFYTNKGETKPNPKVLRGIVDKTGEAREQIIYVGDSLRNDIYMAQKADIKDIYAKYGAVSNRKAYELLQRVSHWDKEKIENETRIQITPTYTLEKSFSELLNLFDFAPYHKRYAGEVIYE